MDIKIHSAVEIDEKFREYINEKFGKLGKFIFGKGQAELYIKKEGHMFLSEIKITSKNPTIFIEEKNDDLNTGIEILYDRAKRQLRKLHDKITEIPHS